MRRKPLIIGLFTAALVAAAVPVASAATGGGGDSPTSCNTYQYSAPKGSGFRFHPEGKEPSQEFPATTDVLFNAHDTHGMDNTWYHGNAHVTVNGVRHQVKDVDMREIQLHYIRCW